MHTIGRHELETCNGTKMRRQESCNDGWIGWNSKRVLSSRKSTYALFLTNEAQTPFSNEDQTSSLGREPDRAILICAKQNAKQCDAKTRL